MQMQEVELAEDTEIELIPTEHVCYYTTSGCKQLVNNNPYSPTNTTHSKYHIEAIGNTHHTTSTVDTAGYCRPCIKTTPPGEQQVNE